MDKQVIEDAVKTKMLFALRAAAELIKTESVRFTPVYTGVLRREKEVRVDTKEPAVYLVQSPEQSKSRKYAAAQYFKSLRHYGSQDNLRPLPEVLVRKKGKGDKYIYGARYRNAIKSNQLTKMEAPRWFERAVTDPKTLNRIGMVIRNAFAGR